PAGLAVQCQATGNYSDLTQHDLTTAVTWDSSVKSAATISPLGLAQSKAVGTTAISAAAGGQTGSANFTVTAPVLQFVDISPQVYTLIEPASQQLSVFGVLTDGSSQNL